MIADVWWRARDEIRRYLAFADIGGDPAKVGIFAQGAEAAGYDHFGAPITFGGSMSRAGLPGAGGISTTIPFPCSGFVLILAPLSGTITGTSPRAHCRPI